MASREHSRRDHRDFRLLQALLANLSPGPGVPVPERWKKHERSFLRTAVGDRDPDQDVVDRLLRILHLDVEVSVFVKDSRVEQFVLRLKMGAPAVFGQQILIGECCLRIFVEPFAVGMGRRRVEIVVELLDVLAVVALRTGETEEALLEDRVISIPEGETEAEPAEPVAQSHQTILTPPVGTTARLIKGEGGPDIAVRRVILAHCPPLTLREVGAPELPEALSACIFAKAYFLGGHCFGFGEHAFGMIGRDHLPDQQGSAQPKRKTPGAGRRYRLPTGLFDNVFAESTGRTTC